MARCESKMSEMFSLSLECGAARVGRIATERGSMTTPGMLLSMRKGDVHGLTPEEWTKLNQTTGIIMNAFDFVADGIGKNWREGGGPKGAEFLRLETPFTICVPKDVIESEFVTSNNDKGVSVMLRMGKRQISPSYYDELIQKIQPDVAVSLWDEVPSTASDKRMKQAIFRSTKWLQKGMEKEVVVGSVSRWAAIMGGNSLDLRRLAAQKAASLHLDGYLLCGFGHGDLQTDFTQLLEATLTPLDPAKPKLMTGILSPDEMLSAIQKGVDLFDSSFVWDICSKRQVLTWPENNDDCHYALLDITDARFQADGNSLAADCGCFCCQHHSRAYVHHLLSENEILGEVLLQMHNLFWIFAFFNRIRVYMMKGCQLQEFVVKGPQSLCP